MVRSKRMRLVGVIVDVSNGSECCIHRLFLVPAYPDCPDKRAIKQVHCFIVDVMYRAVRNWRALDVNAFSDDLRLSELVTALPESNVDVAL